MSCVCTVSVCCHLRIQTFIIRRILEGWVSESNDSFIRSKTGTGTSVWKEKELQTKQKHILVSGMSWFVGS